jgi:hypothetical protein
MALRSNLKPDPVMNTKEKLLYVIGVTLLVFGVPMLVLCLIGVGIEATGGTFGSGKTDAGGMIAATLLFGMLPTVSGYLICRRMKHRARHRTREEMEHKIMKLARECEGRVTVGDVQMITELNFLEAQKLLEEYTINGITEMEITESGVKVYRFYDLISNEEKRSARGL